MKKLILFFVFVISLGFTKTNAQNLKNDPEFFKTSTYIYTALGNFDEVYKAEDRDKVRTDKLPLLKRNIEKINVSYNLIKNKYTTDSDFKQFDLWVKGINTYYKMLQEDDETWMLGFSLTKLDILEFYNLKY